MFYQISFMDFCYYEFDDSYLFHASWDRSNKRLKNTIKQVDW